MVKLIVTDFDGTLKPFGESAVSDSVKRRIKAALNENITVAVSSGRTYGELISYLPEFADDLYFICCDGAYYVKGEKTLYQKKIEKEDIALFFKEAGCDFSFVLHGAFKNYSVGTPPLEAKKFNAVPIKRAEEIDEKIFKVTTYGKEFKPSAYSGLRMHWDGGANLSAQYVNKFANKGTALSDLQMRLMLAKYDTACIGDSGNDVVMMRGAKYSFSVGNRCEQLLKSTASHVLNAETAFDEILSI